MSGSCPGLVLPAEPDARLREMSGSCPGLVLPFVGWEALRPAARDERELPWPRAVLRRL